MGNEVWCYDDIVVRMRVRRIGRVKDRLNGMNRIEGGELNGYEGASVSMDDCVESIKGGSVHGMKEKIGSEHWLYSQWWVWCGIGSWKLVEWVV